MFQNSKFNLSSHANSINSSFNSSPLKLVLNAVSHLSDLIISIIAVITDLSAEGPNPIFHHLEILLPNLLFKDFNFYYNSTKELPSYPSERNNITLLSSEFFSIIVWISVTALEKEVPPN